MSDMEDVIALSKWYQMRNFKHFVLLTLVHEISPLAKDVAESRGISDNGA